MNTKKSLAVAQYMLDRCRKAGYNAITPQLLIKLVYVAHGYMLGKHGQPLLGESVKAWRHGPVVASVYGAIRCFGGNAVENVPGAQRGYVFSAEERQAMDHVAMAYGKYSGVTLSAATHHPNTPWSMTWTAIGRNCVLSNDLIRHFYERIVKTPAHSAL